MENKRKSGPFRGTSKWWCDSTDFVLHVFKSQKCPEIEWTSLGAIVSSPSLKAFKYIVDCDTASLQRHYYRGDTTEIKPWDRDSVVSKITLACETKARRISDTSAIDGFRKNSKTYFDDSRVIPTSSVLRKRGTLQGEKTIFIFCSTEDIFTFSNIV